MNQNQNKAFLRKPDWLIKKKDVLQNHNMKKLLRDYNLHTVCESASCPNISECFKNNTATFMILGDICTRDCKFCGVEKGFPKFSNEKEAEDISEIIEKLKLAYLVLTMVTRDDLEDGGADYFVEMIKKIREKNKKQNLYIEVLTSDFFSRKFKDFEKYKIDLIDYIKSFEKAGINVFGHNLETVKRVYGLVRNIAKYDISLNFLKILKETISPDSNILVKTGLMLGLGESFDEVKETFFDIKETGCDILVLGQYLSPSLKHYPVNKYLSPEEFENYKKLAIDMGFKAVESGPFVRSSYNAKNIYERIISKN